jgi:hypothetical protein
MMVGMTAPTLIAITVPRQVLDHRHRYSMPKNSLTLSDSTVWRQFYLPGVETGADQQAVQQHGAKTQLTPKLR